MLTLNLLLIVSRVMGLLPKIDRHANPIERTHFALFFWDQRMFVSMTPLAHLTFVGHHMLNNA